MERRYCLIRMMLALTDGIYVESSRKFDWSLK